MTDGLQGLRDDVAFMRALAEEGRSAPMIGGSMMASAGLIFGIASLVFYAELTGALDLPGTGLIWLVAMVLYAVIGISIILRIRRQPGYNAAANQATGAAWSSVGYTIFAVWVAFALATVRTGEEVIMYMFSPVIIALYGLAWSVAAAIARKPWMHAIAITAFVAAAATAWYAGEPEMFLVYTAALVLTALAPGLYLMRLARPPAA